MKIRELVTYSFARNVGNSDRLLRVILGVTLLMLPWLVSMPRGLGYLASIIGAMTALTGIASRCALYYLSGFSTCPITNTHRGTER